MSKSLIAYLSAAIFIAYGFFASRWLFIFLGLVFVVIGVADWLRSKN